MKTHDLSQGDREMGERLLFRLTEFCRLLWESGLTISTHQLLELNATLPLIDISHADDFYQTLKCTLLTKHEQEALFNELYHYYWFARHNISTQQADKESSAPDEKNPFRLPPSERKRVAEQLQNQERAQLAPESSRSVEQKQTRTNPPSQAGDSSEQSNTTAYSALEALRQKDFEHFSWEELQDAKQLLAAMKWHLGTRMTQRKVAARKGETLDLRRLLRENRKYGGEIVQLRWRSQQEKPRPLLILCDISGSMSLYSRILLHFLHTISNDLHNVETFVFGTRLTRITRQLKRRDVDTAVKEVTASVQDWSGGTRIGESLHTFNQVWLKRTGGHNPIVIIISDGWDRGEPSLLNLEMDRLQHSSHRLIWLNPLLGLASYRPFTSGMKAALPYIDDFRSVHNIDSLLGLGQSLEKIDQQRPSRSPVSRRANLTRWLARNQYRPRSIQE